MKYRNEEKRMKGLAFVHLSVIEESSHFIPYSKRARAYQACWQAESEAVELGLRGDQKKKMRILKPHHHKTAALTPAELREHLGQPELHDV